MFGTPFGFDEKNFLKKGGDFGHLYIRGGQCHPHKYNIYNLLKSWPNLGFLGPKSMFFIFLVLKYCLGKN